VFVPPKAASGAGAATIVVNTGIAQQQKKTILSATKNAQQQHARAGHIGVGSKCISPEQLIVKFLK